MPILEKSLVATGGNVVVTFVSKDAGFTSELFLDGDIGDQLGAIFDSLTTPIGTMVDLGSFAEGSELIFRLLVRQTGDSFYTGPGSRNPDGLVHAVLRETKDRVLVGFEDMFGGGDLDYDDLVFAFTNVKLVDDGTGEVTVDEPGTLLMLGSGLLGIAFAMRRQAAKR